MAVSPGFKSFVIEQLSHVSSITAKNMFGGVGLYAEAYFFALISSDRLFFKVDDSTQPDFEVAGMGPFNPYGDGRTMRYYEVPVDVLEDVDELKKWAQKAIKVAQLAKKSKKPKRRK
ncbi:MAG: TfoX/Sxy family protein [Rhodothermales bacterium]